VHGEAPAVVQSEELVQAHQVRMRKVGERSKLLLEAVDRTRVQPIQELERWPLLALAIPHHPDRAERARAEVPFQLETRWDLAGSDGSHPRNRPRLQRQTAERETPPQRAASRCITYAGQMKTDI